MQINNWFLLLWFFLHPSASKNEIAFLNISWMFEGLKIWPCQNIQHVHKEKLRRKQIKCKYKILFSRIVDVFYKECFKSNFFFWRQAFNLTRKRQWKIFFYNSTLDSDSNSDYLILCLLLTHKVQTEH